MIINPYRFGVQIAPTVQAHTILYSAISDTTQDISWTRGNGANCIVVVKATTVVNAEPTGTYTANAAFGSGDQIGTGNFVVYAGTGTSVSITGLTAGVLYFIRVYEHNSGVYNTNTASLNGVSEWSTTAKFSSGDTIETNFATLTLAEQRALNRLWALSSIEKNTGAGNNAAKLYTLQLYAGFSSSTKALLDWVAPVTPTLVNTPSFAQATGFTTNGTNNYVNSQINPSTVNGGSPVGLNDVAYGIYIVDNITAARAGVIGTTSTGQWFTTVTNAGVVGTKIHTNATFSHTNAVYLGKDFQTITIRRPASNLQRLNFTGQQISTNTDASISVPVGRTAYIGARNNNGTADQFGEASYGAFWISSETDFDHVWWEFCLDLFMMELGVKSVTTLYPLDKSPLAFSATKVPVRSFAGQSNSAFTTRSAGPPPAPLDAAIPNTKTFWRDPFTDPLTIEDLDYGLTNSYDVSGLTAFSSGLRSTLEMQLKIGSLQYVWEYCISGTALDATDPNGWYPDNTLKLFYDLTERLGTDGFAAISEEIIEISFHWDQGEADAIQSRTQAEYTDDFYYFVSKYIDAIESYGIDLTTISFRIFITRIWSGLNTGTYITRDDIRAAQAAFSVANYETDYPADVGKIDDFIIYDCDDLLHTDGVHKDTEALKLEAFRYGIYTAMS